MRRTSGFPTIRQATILLAGAGLCVPPVLLASCADSTKHRLLTFFFDGVPKPGEEAPVEGYRGIGRGATSRPFNRATMRPSSAGVVYAHTPYAQNKCGGCHERSTGRLIVSEKEGLCRICHTKAFDDARYVHGPVAVNACYFCHHYHSSGRPAMLLDEPSALCLLCHKPGDVAADRPHHAEIEERSCLECHDPHKGNNRFFLTQDGD